MIHVVSSFVPRNEKLVEVDGNLIMNEIITREKTSRATFNSLSTRNKYGHIDTISLKKEPKNNSLAVIE